MDRKDKLEGEEIQKGLEQFLEQELYGAAGSDPKPPKTGELDLSLAQSQPSKEPDAILSHKTGELDMSLSLIHI